jgi:hypothetical protein
VELFFTGGGQQLSWLPHDLTGEKNNEIKICNNKKPCKTFVGPKFLFNNYSGGSWVGNLMPEATPILKTGFFSNINAVKIDGKMRNAFIVLR